MKLKGENRSTRGKPSLSEALSTTNPTWTDPRSNPGLRCETVDKTHGKNTFLASQKIVFLSLRMKI
jgi:hypothetical protein